MKGKLVVLRQRNWSPRRLIPSPRSPNTHAHAHRATFHNNATSPARSPWAKQSKARVSLLRHYVAAALRV